MSDAEVQRRAVWVRNSPNNLILKCLVRDGSTVLATIEERGVLSYVWTLADGTSGQKESEYAAQRTVRKVLRKNATDEARSEETGTDRK